jgi:hypothetical protein
MCNQLTKAHGWITAPVRWIETRAKLPNSYELYRSSRQTLEMDRELIAGGKRKEEEEKKSWGNAVICFYYAHFIYEIKKKIFLRYNSNKKMNFNFFRGGFVFFFFFYC